MFSPNRNEEIFLELKELNIIILHNKKTKEYLLFNTKDKKYRYDLIDPKIIKTEKTNEILHIFKEIYQLEELNSRTESLLNKEIDLLIGYRENKENLTFGSSVFYLKNCGCTEFEEKKSKIIKIFNNQEELKKEHLEQIENKKEKRYFYGHWNIEKNEFGLMYPSIIQSQICFGDSGNHSLKKGSLFIKFEILN